MIERSVLSRVYFGKEHVSRHQLDSFNNFLEHNLQKVVNEQKVIQTDIDSRGKSRLPVWVELGTITVEKPVVREADGSQGSLFPSEARLRNLTYAAPIYLTMTLMHGDSRQDPVVAN
ncbi:MAG TPA: DNA-directed RNA polymerase subunit B'', partial [Methanomicrobiales archaeon]|nr:DNA-directed RNA polymerase subunit B'' [Methanomicrobiales archaeon]